RPQFLNDNEIVFSIHNSRGETGLMLLKMTTGKTRAILQEFLPLRQARNSKAGLLFVSDKNGISNLYLASKDLNHALALTNTQTEIINGEFDSTTEQIIYSQLAPDGPQLFSSDLPKTNSESQIQLKPVKPLISSYWKIPPPGPKLNEVKMTTRDFSSWPYLYPRYWVPFIYPIEGGALFQGSTSAGDPLGKHSYLLDASYDTLTEKPSYGVHYLNATTSVDWNLSFSEVQQYLSAYDAILTDRGAGVLGNFYLSSQSERFRGGLGYSYIESESPYAKTKRQGPTASFLYSSGANDENGEDDEDNYSEDHSSNYHTQFSISHTEYIEQKDFVAYGRSSFVWSQYISAWLPQGHSFVSQLRGAFAPQMQINQVITLGDKTVGANYAASLLSSAFLVRGYPSTTFVGRKIINGNLEYRFPLADIFRGKELFPLFFNDLKASIFTDIVAVDGGAFDVELEAYKRSELNKFYYGVGGELKLATTMAYQFPVSFVLGAYFGLDQSKQGGFQPFFGIGIGGLADANRKAVPK
ncbi:MAG: hypothetical protein KDD35_05490, partial [Bdellovibrionales bacterium]|nr:hypothetical protein [Bdellovibrionales bacterium]